MSKLYDGMHPTKVQFSASYNKKNRTLTAVIDHESIDTFLNFDTEDEARAFVEKLKTELMLSVNDFWEIWAEELQSQDDDEGIEMGCV